MPYESGRFLVYYRDMEFSRNELNNIVYGCLRYIWSKPIGDLENPENKFIHEILLCINESPDLDNIVDQIVEAIYRRYAGYLLGVNIKKMKHIMKTFIFDFKTNLPAEIRENLGADKDAEAFITKH